MSKFIKISGIVLPIAFAIVLSCTATKPAFSADYTSKMMSKIDSIEYLTPATSQQKTEIPARLKSIYKDLITKYPELKLLDAPKIFITKYYVDKAGGKTGGTASPYPINNDSCSIELGIDEFADQARIKTAYFHELMHCWSGLTKGKNDDERDSFMTKLGNIEETSIWPIQWDYAKFGDYDGRDFYNTLTDIFIKRGDKGDRWRILLAARIEGRGAFEERLSYLDIPKGYSSRLLYMESLLGEDANGFSTFGEGLTWLKSKTPPPADYKTYDFGDSSSTPMLTQGSSNGDTATGASASEETGTISNADTRCPPKPPAAGPSEGQDYQHQVAANFEEQMSLANPTEYDTSNPAAGIDAASSNIIAETARQEVGYQGNGDCTKYDGCAQWCAYFVNWVYNKAGFNTPEIGTARGTFDWFKKNHRTFSEPSQAQPGDIVVWKRSADYQGHIGIVFSNDITGKKMVVIEGNTSSDMVKSYIYSYNAIIKKQSGLVGFGRW